MEGNSPVLTSNYKVTVSTIVNSPGGSFMSVSKAIVLLFAVSTLTFLVACGGSGNGLATGTAPPSGAFSDSNLNGPYVFSVSGLDQSGFPYSAVGVFTANGSGGITAGSIDMNDTEFTTPLFDASIGGTSTYRVGADGRGTATLVLPASSSPFSINVVLDFVLQDSFHGLVIEFDDAVSGSGTLDQQTSGVTPTGSYAFLLSGNSYSSSGALALAGNFAVGSGGALTGLEDFNEGGTNAYTNQTLTGTLIVGPSTTPTTTISNPLTAALQTYDVFAIDASHLKIIEMDTFATLSGDAYSQTSATMPVGAMAFTLFGNNLSGLLATGGFMVTDVSGNITSASSEDYNSAAGVSAAAGSFTGTYAGSAGRYTLGSFANFVGGSSYAAYPSSGGVLLLEIDTTGLTAGAAYPQTGMTFAASQGYGLNLTGVNLGAVTGEGTGSDEEVDDIAEFTANSGGTVTGVIDENYSPSGGPNPALELITSSSSYGSIDATGRYGLSVGNGNSNNSTLNGGFNLVLYSVDGVTFPFIEADSSQVATGVIIEQNAAATTPFAAKAHSMFIPRPIVVPRMAKQKKQN
jgi:hypothetical protein